MNDSKGNEDGQPELTADGEAQLKSFVRALEGSQRMRGKRPNVTAQDVEFLKSLID
jgi:hypothetical protein